MLNPRNLKLYRKVTDQEALGDIPDHIDDVIAMGLNTLKRVYLQRELMDEI